MSEASDATSGSAGTLAAPPNSRIKRKIKRFGAEPYKSSEARGELEVCASSIALVTERPQPQHSNLPL